MSMNSVKVNRVELLNTISKNRDTHRNTFLEAQKGFREEVIKALDKMLDNARKGIKYSQSVGLPEPQDMTKEYDCAIAMLKMSVDEVIEIDEHEFKQYVLDQWVWKQNWKSVTDVYNAKKSL